MSVESFIPEIWAAELLPSLKQAQIFTQGSVVNRNYQGEIKRAGDSVHINSVSRPTISTYVPNSTTLTHEQLTTAQQTLIVDQFKSFDFYLDDVDEAQALGGLMEEAMAEAGYGLADTTDSFVAALYTGVTTANDLGTVTVTSGNAYSKLVDLKTTLDEANVPKMNRYVIIPPWYEGLLLLDDRFVKVDASGTSEGLRNGIVGRAVGFDVLVSNNCVSADSGDDNIVQAGYPGSITYADQLVKTEAGRSEDNFSDYVRGLHVYGAKLIRPDGIAVMQASQS